MWGTHYISPAHYQICIIKEDTLIGHIEATKLRVKKYVCLTVGNTLNQMHIIIWGHFDRSYSSHETKGKKYVCLTVGTLFIFLHKIKFE
jgi:hypothetical protein